MIEDEYLTPILVLVLTILIAIVVYVGMISVNKTFKEMFGSSCVDFVQTPTWMATSYPVKKDAIFISVASYRDEECSKTIDTIFNMAAKPENIFVGICEQNKEGDKKEICIGPTTEKWLKNIKIVSMDYLDAKGPTYARYWCSTLWTGEEYFLQIDSHTTFMKNWDIDLIHMLKQCTYSDASSSTGSDDLMGDGNDSWGTEGSRKPVLSTYPPTDEQMNMTGYPVIDGGKIGGNGLPMFLAGFRADTSSKPVRGPKPFYAAGFLFTYGKMLQEIPFDPSLSHLFQGEEVLFSARLFTNGWDIYAPNKKVCFHHYNREGSPLYWKDNKKDHSSCRTEAEKKVMFLLGLANRTTVADEFLREYHVYGLGTFRTMEDYWNASGVDMANKTMTSSTDVGPENDKYNFEKSGWLGIKKWMMPL